MASSTTTINSNNSSSRSSSSNNNDSHTNRSSLAANSDSSLPPKPLKRRKVAKACLFCKRSHMTCDDSRPCQRCIKRDIGHLCCDEPPRSTSVSNQPPRTLANNSLINSYPDLLTHSNHLHHHQLSSIRNIMRPITSSSSSPSIILTSSRPPFSTPPIPHQHTKSSDIDPSIFGLTLLPMPQKPGKTEPANLPVHSSTFIYPPNSASHQTLETLPATGSPHQTHPKTQARLIIPNSITGMIDNHQSVSEGEEKADGCSNIDLDDFLSSYPSLFEGSTPNVGLPSPSDALPDNFSQPVKVKEEILDDRISGSNGYTVMSSFLEEDEAEKRLERMIREEDVVMFDDSKSEQRMIQWVEEKVSDESKSKVMALFRESRGLFASITTQQSVKELIDSEYQFKRHLIQHFALLDTLPIPGCIWRRTGEIEKGNQQFKELIGMGDYETGEISTRNSRKKEGGDVMLRQEENEEDHDHQCCLERRAVYEIWDEDSNLNYWENFNRIALDQSQKAVMTSCVLLKQSPRRVKDPMKHSGDWESDGKQSQRVSASVNCTFSFTIKRDSFGLPSLVIGNFLPS